jgi:hypothetical protein
MGVQIPLAAFAAAVIAHALWRRVFSGRTAVVTFIVWSAIWAGAVAAIEIVRYDLTSALTALLLYALASELYIFVFTLSAHSVSARLLAVLDNGPRGALDLEDVCDPERMVQERKTQMLQTGLLSRASSEYRVTDKGRRVLDTFERLHRFFFPAGNGK